MCCRELMWTLSDAELNLLEKSLCSTDDVDRSSAMLAELSGLPPELLLTCDTQPLSEFYADDLSDSDDAAVSRGLMVHSESTMTVVARPSAAESAEAAARPTTTSTPVLTDAEARRLQHSKSWPQSADGRRPISMSSDGGTTSAVAVYGNQQFNFNLPHNTSTELLYPDAAAAASERFADQSIIYLSSPTTSVDDEQQIAYITDELCRIFCTDTASLEDDDDDDIEILSSDVAGAELLAAGDSEVSLSMQQRCLEGIPCECEGSMLGDGMASMDDSLLKSTVGDVTVPSVGDRYPVSEDDCSRDVRSSFMDSPSSTEDSSSTLNTADNISPPTVSELSADILVACNDVVPVLSSSPSELPSVETPATFTDIPTGVSSPSGDEITCSSDDVTVAVDDVAVAMSEEDITDLSVSAASCHVADSDVNSTPSSSSHHSLHHSNAKPTPVIETDAVKVEGTKCPSSSSQGWNCASDAAANIVELSRDHERCVSLNQSLVQSINQLGIAQG